MTTVELMSRCSAEWERLRSVPQFKRDRIWQMQLDNCAHMTAEAMRLACAEETKAPAVTLDRRFLRVPRPKREGMC